MLPLLWPTSWPSSGMAGEIYPLSRDNDVLAKLGNLCRYRTLTDRALGMRLTYAQRTMSRNVSFEFLNRQLVWHAFTVSLSPFYQLTCMLTVCHLFAGVPSIPATNHSTQEAASSPLANSKTPFAALLLAYCASSIHQLQSRPLSG